MNSFPDGEPRCKCRAENAEAHEKEALKAVGCVIVSGENPNGRFIALVACCTVRDVQICSKSDCDPSDEDFWYDADDVEVYLSEFSGPDALEKAAEYGCTDPANIQLIPIGSPRGNN